MPLDIGIGIFGAIITARVAGLALSWPLIFIAIIFSLLPDADFAVYFLKNKLAGKHIDEFAHEHRDLFHNPIPYIVVGFLIASIWSVPIACLFAALSFWHFFHDSIPGGGGWGIKWLYPFSKKYYKFFSDQNGKTSKNPVASWTFAEQRKTAQQFGDKNWTTNYPRSPEFLFELIIFFLALCTVIVAFYFE